MEEQRYTIKKEWTGAQHRQWVARFCGEWIGGFDLKVQAEVAVIKYGYNRLGSSMAVRNNFLGFWEAQSQYGYVLQECKTKEEAEEYIFAFYATKMYLIMQ